MRHAATLLAVALLAGASASGTAAADGRVAEADALLGDASGFGRAAAIYREVLADAPGDAEVRRKLARVLSWAQRYEESVAEYDRLLSAHPGDRELVLERAEVLSWAGRSEEALAAFEAVIARHPDDPRAARGRARTLRWAGRAAEADRAYARALELEDAPELREERAALRAGYAPQTESEFEFFEDSDDFRRLAASAQASFFPDLDTRLSARAGFLRVDHEVSGAPPALASEDSAGELTLMARRSLGESWSAEIEAGGRIWREAGFEPIARGRLAYSSERIGAAALEVDHRGALDRTASVAALEDGVRDTALRATHWRAYAHGLESFLELQSGFLSDGNVRLAGGATLSWRPWEEPELRLHASTGILAYTRRSLLYYDPKSDVSGLLSATLRQPIWRSLILDLDGGAGYGEAREGGVTGRGPSYRAGAALSWQIGRLGFSLRGSHARSQRATRYVATRALALVSMGFGR